MGIIGEVDRINKLLKEAKDELEEVLCIYTGEPAPMPVEQPEAKSLENELNKADEMSMRILDYSKAILSMFRGDVPTCGEDRAEAAYRRAETMNMRGF